jgi:hypothetical protein
MVIGAVDQRRQVFGAGHCRLRACPADDDRRTRSSSTTPTLSGLCRWTRRQSSSSRGGRNPCPGSHENRSPHASRHDRRPRKDARLAAASTTARGHKASTALVRRCCVNPWAVAAASTSAGGGSSQSAHPWLAAQRLSQAPQPSTTMRGRRHLLRHPIASNDAVLPQL